MSLSDIERRILDLVFEDSYALSEIVSRLGDAYDELPPKEVKKLARATIHALFEVDWIEITKLESPEGTEPTLERSAAETALADDLNWLELKSWRPHIRVVATAAGREAYYSR